MFDFCLNCSFGFNGDKFWLLFVDEYFLSVFAAPSFAKSKKLRSLAFQVASEVSSRTAGHVMYMFTDMYVCACTWTFIL